MAEILWTGWQHSHGLRGNIPVDWVAEIRGIRMRGYIQFATFPGALGAPVWLGWWYDQHHSYTVPLWLYTGCNFSHLVAGISSHYLVEARDQTVPITKLSRAASTT